MEADQFQRWREDIRYCRSPEILEGWVQRILAPTGFGSNSLAETDEPIGLDYREMADCLAETDRAYFEREIALLELAYRQLQAIADGTVPDQPIPVNPWELLM